MALVFMGTPDFAVPALSALKENGFEVGLVVTQPDRPQGRGRKTAPPPVKKRAMDLGLPVYQANSARNEDFFQAVKQVEPDFLVVVAFGMILPQKVLDIPRVWPVNIHPSLLPKYRGPAPIHHALLSGDDVTGVTTMKMDAGQDTGDILLQITEPVAPRETAETLHDRLALMGADLLVQTLNQAGQITPMAQDDSRASLAPMLKKSDGEIDWRKPADYVERFVRAMHPWPGAFTYLQGKRIKVLGAAPTRETTGAAPGTVISGRDRLLVATGEGVVEITRLQGANSKAMDARAFLRGHPIDPGCGMGKKKNS